jgi:hypothetical protein
MSANVITFRVACCSKLGITNGEFEKRVLLKCLPRYYWLHGRIRWYVNRSYFDPDLELIRATADCTSVNQIISKINYFHKQEFFINGYERKSIRFRVSGHRLTEFAKQFLPNGSHRPD